MLKENTLLLLLLLLLLLFRVAPAAYGGFQAGGAGEGKSDLQLLAYATATAVPDP